MKRISHRLSAVKYGFRKGNVLSEEDLELLESEIAYVTRDTDIDAVALVSSEGYNIAVAAVPGCTADWVALGGLASALQTTCNLAMFAVRNEQLNEIIVRAGDGYVVVTNAGQFILVGVGRNMKNLQTTVEVFRTAASHISYIFTAH